MIDFDVIISYLLELLPRLVTFFIPLIGIRAFTKLLFNAVRGDYSPSYIHTSLPPKMEWDEVSANPDVLESIREIDFDSPEYLMDLLSKEPKGFFDNEE